MIELSILLNVAGSAAWDGIKFLYHLIKLQAEGARETGEEPKLTLTQGIYHAPMVLPSYGRRSMGRPTALSIGQNLPCGTICQQPE